MICYMSLRRLQISMSAWPAPAASEALRETALVTPTTGKECGEDFEKIKLNEFGSWQDRIPGSSRGTKGNEFLPTLI